MAKAQVRARGAYPVVQFSRDITLHRDDTDAVLEKLHSPESRALRQVREGLRQACSSRKKQAIALSDSAAKRIRHLLDLWNKHYLRVGCNGYSYTMNYADQAERHDELVEDNGGRPASADEKIIGFHQRSHNWEDGTNPWEDELFYNERINNLSKRVTKEHIDVLRANANPDHICILQECYMKFFLHFILREKSSSSNIRSRESDAVRCCGCVPRSGLGCCSWMWMGLIIGILCGLSTQAISLLTISVRTNWNKQVYGGHEFLVGGHGFNVSHFFHAGTKGFGVNATGHTVTELIPSFRIITF
ncbi:uncharacterized protein LOC9656757 [Selaginella moellendorffii]|uniref:uncharacterized protein LOC9656757 n=1 Tax=Selaginella moellendorffii TaxID=88036 RepID=UPI000D1CA95F|nr:uncharacterized protein LOC9656757 [Selaginella moellendorffii]|eukprot:XP_024517639.1 uncharacterized protein LOC9656757 [Selaginella moellendorffii]